MIIDKNIITPKVDIDDDIIGRPNGGEMQGVLFKIFWTNEKYANIINSDLEGLKPKNVKERSGACFADLRHMFIKERHNTFFYRVNNVHKSVIDKMPAWLETLTKEKIIPKYNNKDMSISGTIILDITKTTIPTIYIKLCMLRYLREYPKVVIGSLYLMKLGIDFFTAVTFCASKLIWSSGHNFIFSTCKYGESDSPYNKALIDARLIWATRELTINGSRHSKYHLGNAWIGFQAIKTIDEIVKKLPLLEVTLAELLRPDLTRALKNSDEKYVCKFFNEYREQQNVK